MVLCPVCSYQGEWIHRAHSTFAKRSIKRTYTAYLPVDCCFSITVFRFQKPKIHSSIFPSSLCHTNPKRREICRELFQIAPVRKQCMVTETTNLFLRFQELLDQGFMHIQDYTMRFQIGTMFRLLLVVPPRQPYSSIQGAKQAQKT